MICDDEKFLQEQIKKILQEQDSGWGDNLGGLEWGEFDMGVEAQQVYDTFVGPFVDVVKVSSVAFKDISSTVLSTLDQITTFDLEKKKQIQQQFRADRKKYAAEMEKAMASTFEAFNNNDAKLLMFMLNPGAFLGATMAKDLAGSGLTEPFTDFAADKLGGIATDMGWGAEARGEKVTTEPDRGPLRGLMNDLKVLFFGEGLDEIDEIELILREQEEAAEEKYDVPGEEEIVDAVNKQMEEMGISKEFEKLQKQIIDSKAEEIEFIKAEVEETLAIIGELQLVKTIADLQAPIQRLKELGVDLTAASAEVEKTVASQIESLKRGDEEGKELMAQLKETPDGAALDPENPEEFIPALEQASIASAFGEATQKVKESFGGDLVGFVGEHSRDELKQIAAGSPMGAEYVALIDEFEQWFNQVTQ